MRFFSSEYEKKIESDNPHNKTGDFQAVAQLKRMDNEATCQQIIVHFNLSDH